MLPLWVGVNYLQICTFRYSVIDWVSDVVSILGSGNRLMTSTRPLSQIRAGKNKNKPHPRPFGTWPRCVQMVSGQMCVFLNLFEAFEALQNVAEALE